MQVTAIPLSHSLGEGRGFGGSRGLTQFRSATLVRLETADGTVGWGEALAPPRSVATVVDEVLAERVRGMDPYDVETLTADLYVDEYHFGRGPLVHSAVSAVDIALWDILGKATGRSVSDLLGTSSASAFLSDDDDPTEVVPYASTMYVTEWGEDPAEPMRAAADEGFTAAKIKVGRNVADDVERVATAREILGDDAHLMVDFNGNYRPKQAAEAAAALEPYGITWIEEPVPPENLSGYAELKRYTTIPLAAGEAHFNRFEFKRLIDGRHVDIVQPNVTHCGGFSEGRFIAKLAATENVTVLPHVWNGGVGLAAALHLAASVPSYPHAGSLPEHKLFEVDRSENPLREELLSDPLEPTDGTISVPRGPGLGVDVDEAAIERYRID
ncbi:mandelate racemase/muconate lactonizing enzyme family protein [Halegenticoccus tardaugens]|uniref:mandelate racemase/muconate lactonizing enzyme family protein n=1 Tax=Halegenticoccus tardaugens TaxID=2071624 RepID=UPI00100BFB07